jgi:hypothetical protein
MVYVALAEAAALALIVITLASLIRSQQRAHARREDLLLNQMLNLAGKPWQPSPAMERPDPEEREPRFWTMSPEQGIGP